MSDCKVITLLSGKGGSGKTTVAISICKLLSDMGLKTLLVDFDFATDGASYFFKDRLKPRARALWDIIEGQGLQNSTPQDLLVNISDTFYFIPSRIVNKKARSYDSVAYNRDFLKEAVLAPILSYANKVKFDYALIDCQAGFAISSGAAAQLAEMAVFVTEPDAISSDATDNLLIQMGDSLPETRRYLVNKIDVRDADTYRNMTDVFQTLNRLPPLPFDFAVRNAFGARQLPVDVKKPSALLFALLETVKALFPELRPRIEEYREEHIDRLFNEYQQNIEKLVIKREHLERDLAHLKSRKLNFRYRFLNQLFIITGGGVALYGLGFLLTDFFKVQIVSMRYISLVTATVILGLALYTLYQFRLHAEDSVYDEREQLLISKELEQVTRDIDKFRSLLWARSRDYLLDTEIEKVSQRQERKSAATVYVQARPKGRPEGSPIQDYVIENYADEVLGTFRTQKEAIDWAKANGHHPLVARVRHLNDKKIPDHWRSA
jgi:cellulose biosynthesis protein BcsQ